MRAAEVVRDYVALARHLDALLPGAAAVPDGLRRVGTTPVASALARDAGRLAAALPAAALGTERERFLRAQVLAVESTAWRLAGRPVPFGAEVAAVYDVRPELGAPESYGAAHRALDDLLPGRAPLSERLRTHRARDVVPPELVGPAVQALSTALRARTRELVPLPDTEHVEYRVVADAPWSALHQYLGGFRSLVTVNAGAGPRWTQLVHLVAHEAYPGHHTERCRKEAGLAAAGWDEHRVTVVCSPQGTVAEAAADLGLDVLVGPRWGRLAAEALDGVLTVPDPDLAERVHAATAVLARVRQDAAVLLHGHGAAPADVLTHLRRWALLDGERARRVLRFLRHPLWRTYPVTYVEGGDLVRRWWDRDPRPERYARLLDEPLTPAVLRAELAGGAPVPVRRQVEPAEHGHDGRTATVVEW